MSWPYYDVAVMSTYLIYVYVYMYVNVTKTITSSLFNADTVLVRDGGQREVAIIKGR